MKRIPVTLSVFVAIVLAAGSARSQFVLTPIPNLPGVGAGSVAWGDYDNDGRLDFLLSGSLEISLWHNTGNGFSNVTATLAPGLPGLYDSAVAWGDFDNDGRLDFLITGLTNLSGGAVSQLWRNTGHGFTNVPVPGLPGLAESTAAWIDFDGDGKLDFFIAGTSNGISSGAVSQLWRNTSTGFTNVPIPGLAGAYFGSCAWADFDNDGRPDLLITGITNSATGGSAAQLWRNTGSGFTNVPIPALRGLFASSVACGDYDNDGRLDFLMEGLAGNTFVTEPWRNTGIGFTNVAIPGLPGIADGSLAWGDFDNDGRLDFLVTGLTNGVTEVAQLWRNTGSGFTNIPVPGLPGSFDNLLAWGDYDNDGRLDFLIAGTIEGNIVSQLWRNIGLSSNSPSAAPAGLSASVSGDTVHLNWSAPADDHTPAKGLRYDLRIGTTPGGADIISPGADPVTGWRRVATLGNLGENLSAVLSLPPGNYYWSVQAVDSGLAGSPFAIEQQFSVSPGINGIRDTNGFFELVFTAKAGSRFTAFASENVSDSLGNWIELGAVREVSPGYFQFTDAQATNIPQRFYRVRSP